MSLKLQYSPERQDSNEFHRIREWHNTFNAVVQGMLAAGAMDGNHADSKYGRAHIRNKARRFADEVHGSIRKPALRNVDFGY